MELDYQVLAMGLRARQRSFSTNDLSASEDHGVHVPFAHDAGLLHKKNAVQQLCGDSLPMKRSKSVAIMEEPALASTRRSHEQATQLQTVPEHSSTKSGMHLSQRSSSTALSSMSEATGSSPSGKQAAAVQAAVLNNVDMADCGGGLLFRPDGPGTGGTGSWPITVLCESGCTSPSHCSGHHAEGDMDEDPGAAAAAATAAAVVTVAAAAEVLQPKFAQHAMAAALVAAASNAQGSSQQFTDFSSTDDNVQARLPAIRLTRPSNLGSQAVQHTASARSPLQHQVPNDYFQHPYQAPAQQHPQHGQTQQHQQQPQQHHAAPAWPQQQPRTSHDPTQRVRAAHAPPTHTKSEATLSARFGTLPGPSGAAAPGAAAIQQQQQRRDHEYRRARSSLTPVEYAGKHHCSHEDDSSDTDTEEATKRITAAFRSTGGNRHALGGLLGVDSAPTTPTGGAGARGGSADGQWRSGDGSADGAANANGSGGIVRKRSSYHLTNKQAAVELFLRLNHARQTLEFIKRQTTEFAALDKAELSIWEALHMMDELREYEAVLMCGADEGGTPAADMSLLEHALQVAELCRLHHPDKDWLQLAGLLHGLGKLLAHKRFGVQPQWAICGETYPAACRFSPAILGAEYFSANPDRRRRLYNTPLGVYSPACGLANVYMSWGACEYLYLVLELNRVALPQEAMFMIRYCKFASLTKPHSCYLPLCADEDRRLLPLLRHFQELTAWRHVELPPGFALQGEARTEYYTGLINKYIGPGRLQW